MYCIKIFPPKKLGQTKPPENFGGDIFGQGRPPDNPPPIFPPTTFREVTISRGDVWGYRREKCWKCVYLKK